MIIWKTALLPYEICKFVTTVFLIWLTFLIAIKIYVYNYADGVLSPSMDDLILAGFAVLLLYLFLYLVTSTWNRYTSPPLPRHARIVHVTPEVADEMAKHGMTIYDEV